MLQRLSTVFRRPMFWHGTHHHDSNDATKRLFDTVSSTVKGIQQINYVVEHNPKLTAEEKSKMKQFLIYRYDPADENDFPKYVSYYVDLKKIPPMYLDALLYIKDNYDSSLSLRRSCREGICGSCSMNCNGLHKLACIHAIDTDLTQPAYITPLGHMFVVKDLVVDMTNFYTQYKTIDPYLKRKTPKEGNKEYIQSVEDRKLLDGLYECVLCACCSTSCPSYWWHPDRYLGPAVLMQAYRWIVDSRDEYTDERLEKLAEDVKVEDCQNIGMCSFTCPKGLDPQRSMNHLMKLIEEYKERKIASATL
ncbi:unnamed protein product [Paramecium pentaurelia]|uniref:succinate dehydrogenase n=1 Tax=Paramecium pentaurelia TaxID=43138 RepID=A0A8S1V8V4_9CILI|nr:unnamed protein product [Paramecium pentaurelia]